LQISAPKLHRSPGGHASRPTRKPTVGKTAEPADGRHQGGNGGRCSMTHSLKHPPRKNRSSFSNQNHPRRRLGEFPGRARRGQNRPAPNCSRTVTAAPLSAKPKSSANAGVNRRLVLAPRTAAPFRTISCGAGLRSWWNPIVCGASIRNTVACQHLRRHKPAAAQLEKPCS